MEGWKFGEALPPRKNKPRKSLKDRTPVKTARASTDVITEELIEDGRLKHYHSCSCGYRTTGCFNPIGAARTLEFHIKIRHIQ